MKMIAFHSGSIATKSYMYTIPFLVCELYAGHIFLMTFMIWHKSYVRVTTITLDINCRDDVKMHRNHEYYYTRSYMYLYVHVINLQDEIQLWT